MGPPGGTRGRGVNPVLHVLVEAVVEEHQAAGPA